MVFRQSVATAWRFSLIMIDNHIRWILVISREETAEPQAIADKTSWWEAHKMTTHSITLRIQWAWQSISTTTFYRCFAPFLAPFFLAHFYENFSSTFNISIHSTFLNRQYSSSCDHNNHLRIVYVIRMVECGDIIRKIEKWQIMTTQNTC